MDERAAAEEHLRVIRSLMERATVYRAISAPTALVGGVAALLASAWIISRLYNSAGVTTDQMNRDFIIGWFAALGVTAVANTLFLWRGAVRDRRPFFSSGLRLALRSILPSILVAAAVTLVVCRQPSLFAPGVLSVVWMCLYGLALLATTTFSPRSLSVLGWAFVIAGCSWLLLLSTELLVGSLTGVVHRAATLAMAFTFGLFHLVYAACTWSRRATPELPPE